MAEQDAESLVADAARELENVEVPEALRQSLARHNQNMVALTQRLIDSGMDEATIRSVVHRAMDSYKDELISTILAVRGESANE